MRHRSLAAHRPRVYRRTDYALRRTLLRPLFNCGQEMKQSPHFWSWPGAATPFLAPPQADGRGATHPGASRSTEVPRGPKRRRRNDQVRRMIALRTKRGSACSRKGPRHGMARWLHPPMRACMQLRLHTHATVPTNASILRGAPQTTPTDNSTARPLPIGQWPCNFQQSLSQPCTRD